MLVCSQIEKIKFIFASWRNGRAVECTGLENRRTERYRGFESLFLRKENPKAFALGFFVFKSVKLASKRIKNKKSINRANGLDFL